VASTACSGVSVSTNLSILQSLVGPQCERRSWHLPARGHVRHRPQCTGGSAAHRGPSGGRADLRRRPRQVRAIGNGPNPCARTRDAGRDGGVSLIDPPRWNEDELDDQIAQALEAFRRERVTEPVEQYRHVFDEFAARVRTLLAVTDNLSTLQDAAPELLADEDTLDTLRYLAGPPISADDLKTLSGASLAPSRLRDEDRRRYRPRLLRTSVVGRRHQRCAVNAPIAGP